MGGCKRYLKECGIAFLRKLPPCLSSCVMDIGVFVFIGRNGPREPKVEFYRYAPPGAEQPEPVVCDPAELPQWSKEDSVRLVIVSDTHERHWQVTIPEGDVLIHCGDILMSSSLAGQQRGDRVLEDFNRWLASVPCTEKVVNGGNHDQALKDRLLGDDPRGSLTEATAFLHDSAVDLPQARVRIYGNSFSSGKSNNKAWQTEAPQVSNACIGADVVMSHACDDSLVTAVTAQAKPRIWASGHHHGQHGVRPDQESGICFVNACILDKKHRPVQMPVVVDLPRLR